MNPTNMLELQKLVLESVVEDKQLFAKELQKSFQWLDYDDLYKLYFWSVGRFYGQCRTIIDCMFRGFDFYSPELKLATP